MLILFLACTPAPRLTVICSDETGASVFESTCPADAIQILRHGGVVRATCYQRGWGIGEAFAVDAVRCAARPEGT